MLRRCSVAKDGMSLAVIVLAASVLAGERSVMAAHPPGSLSPLGRG